jgi:hypothetical protein
MAAQFRLLLELLSIWRHIQRRGMRRKGAMHNILLAKDDSAAATREFPNHNDHAIPQNESCAEDLINLKLEVA